MHLRPKYQTGETSVILVHILTGGQKFHNGRGWGLNGGGMRLVAEYPLIREAAAALPAPGIPSLTQSLIISSLGDLHPPLAAWPLTPG